MCDKECLSGWELGHLSHWCFCRHQYIARFHETASCPFIVGLFTHVFPIKHDITAFDVGSGNHWNTLV